ncbi:winged helix-turn-helix domain-containing protein [Nonomuraea sp. PA05]|uniref:winged helix-turn-helix domain-containing protein n=1 Tax=Nonomuraea sp. PA05 TaxID=2604466 RepID=UPI0011D4C7F8|nr:crosslink repair DNA glycosylase YcaQ family protein [Nonomuraea sp. PA05]TYB57775.1 winged helix-turn-helix domain-containing protein [Nonomuraea sp. PA05]
MALTLTLESARKLAVMCQQLGGPRPGSDLAGLRSILRSLRCLQLDPVNAVARSHLLVLWSRAGHYDLTALDTLLWQERWLFEYWAHAASIVLAEDYPIHHLMMRRHAAGDSDHARMVRGWLDSNDALRRHVLDRLRDEGPLPPGAFEDLAAVPWKSTGWTNGRNVERMLDFLWTQGHIMVAARQGRTRHWDLAERWLPDWAQSAQLSEEEAVTQAAEHALRALGVARAADIDNHFTRSRYPGLPAVLSALHHSQRVVPVTVEGGDETWYAHVDALALLERDAWQPHTTLLSPFDNLICDRERTQRLWGFAFRTEMYVPKHKRQYGHYIMPILHEERLIGRLVPRMDRRRGVLEIEGVFPEDTATEASAVRAVTGAIEELATFAGAREIVYGEKVAASWRGAGVG